MIRIDGSYGEGGGQILRTALGLSCLFGKTFRIENIRRGRKQPGLMPQHLAAVRAAQLLSGASVSGDNPGSLDLTFSPGPVKGGEIRIDIGTAGSTLLVLQTLLPALAFSGQRASVILTGGTHVPFSPSYHYVAGVLLPVLKGLGIDVNLSIDTYGFYPKGGGKIRAEVAPLKTVRALQSVERGRMRRLTGLSGTQNLPISIAERQRDALLKKLSCHIPDTTASVGVTEAPGRGQGTFVFIMAETEHSFAGFTALGERGKPAEAVGEEAAGELLGYVTSGAALDRHLPDQLVPFLALCSEESVFTTASVIRHLLTNLWAVRLFHPCRYEVTGNIGEPGTVRMRGADLTVSRRS